ncbi:hypothetical protein [Streptomyces sp. NBC_01304]|uniref:hypothetical protein n=1 Tax=Streptomyces sp. NBC_01304 TaxID=2903818 RepID=UPI002E157ACE|nr:hypothetical protein OG430_34905 [Streptomyces sp. NBC_01304]
MSGSLWLPPPSGPASGALPAIPRQSPTWAVDPLDELAERLREFIGAAVHPDEIAALLESDGLTDEQIRLRFGRDDSFSLAEDLYARVERAFPEPERAPDPWRTGLLGCLLRGLVFALPGLAYVLGAPLLATAPGPWGLPAGTVPLLAGALVGWSWNQGVAHRAYTWLGLGDRAAAGRALLLGAPVGAGLGALVSLAASRSGDLPAVLFATGQAIYLGAATVLLVLGRERALLYALLPMTAGAVLALGADLAGWVRVGLLVGSLGAVVVLAARELPATPASRRAASAPSTATPTSVGSWITASIPYAVFGLATGALVLHAALGEVFTEGAAAAIAAPAAVALTISMGPAEWLLYRFRSQSLTGLRRTGTPGAFWRSTTGTLVQCLTAYVLILGLLYAAGTAAWPNSPEMSPTRTAALLLLGTTMWTGLLLQAFGEAHRAAAVCATAAAVQTAAVLTDTGTPRQVALIVPGATALVLATLVCLLLGRATAHRS